MFHKRLLHGNLNELIMEVMTMNNEKIPYKIYLNEDEMPKAWYNLRADMKQTEVFEAAEYFARIEGILPAPESSHAIRAAMDEAVRCKETGEEKTIVFGLTGTGYFDMMSYERFHDGKMDDYIPTDEELALGRGKLPKIE